MFKRGVFLALSASIFLAACGEKTDKPTPIKQVKLFVVGSDSVNASAGSSPVPSSLSSATPLRDPSRLSFDAAGRVFKLLVKEGDAVSAGQALARLDPADLSLSESSARLQMTAAQAELDAAEADFKRFAALHQQGFISPAEIERRKAQLMLARAKFEVTVDQLGFMTLRAIESGRILATTVAEGALVGPGQTVVRLTLAPLAAGQSRSSKPATSSIALSATPQFLRVPITAVMNGEAVYRFIPSETDAQLGKLEKVAVTLGRADEQWVEIRQGLKAGDQIVMAGMHVLTPGEQVRVFSQAQ
jgi:multidrug efflux pump subunit AcrA (membrane-fusion protein)